MSGAGGATATVGGSIGFAGCAARPFAPTLTATLGGEIGPLGHPNVTVGLNARDGDSNLQGATVTLPRGIVADPANLQNACPREVFEATACSAAARASARRPRASAHPGADPRRCLPRPDPRAPAPGLGLSFTGRYTQRVLSTVRVNAQQRLVVGFDAIPDLPLRRLDMTIIGGAQGPIRSPRARARPVRVGCRVPGPRRAAVEPHDPGALPTARAKRAAITLSSKRGLSVRLTDLGGRTLHSMKVTLPTGFTIDRRRAGNRRASTVALTGSKGEDPHDRPDGAGLPLGEVGDGVNLRARCRHGARAARGKGKAVTVTVTVRLGFTDGTVQRQKIRVRAS